MAGRDYMYDELRSSESLATRKFFRTMSEFIFVEEGTTSSRVEVYASGLPLPKNEYNTLDLKEDRHFRHNPDPYAAAVEGIQVVRMRALRNGNDIALYRGIRKEFEAYFIRQRFSHAQLSLTLSLFEDLASSIKMSPFVRDFLLYFGEREREVEVVPPRLKHQLLPQSCMDHIVGSECMYGLRFFENNERGNPNQFSRQWSLRQTAVYCRSEPGSGPTIWVFIALSQQNQHRLDAYVAQVEDLQTADPYDVHLLLLDTALSNWRPYLVDLATEVDAHTAEISGISPDDQGPISLSDAARRQELMLLDKKLLDALLVAKSTIDTIKSLEATVPVASEGSCSKNASTKYILLEKSYNLDLVVLQLENLRAKLLGASTVLSSFLDLGSGLALQNLARESRQENEGMRKLSERMHELTKKAARDAAAVKVLTILSLIYLPATVVSNFFSTSFVGTSPSSSNITVSGDWWILIAVSLPLTILTFYIWYVWKEIQADGNYPLWWRLFSRHKRSKQEIVDKPSDEKV